MLAEFPCCTSPHTDIGEDEEYADVYVYMYPAWASRLSAQSFHPTVCL